MLIIINIKIIEIIMSREALERLLQNIVDRESSDLHLSAGVTPMCRVHGDMQVLTDTILDNDSAQSLIHSVMSEEQKALFEDAMEMDFSMEIESGARFRVNVFMQHRGIAAVFRVIPNEVLTLEQINAPEVLKAICENKSGLVLVTGPTGSGKSTTLAAMINYINENNPEHIITIEDPIEFTHVNKKSLVNQREVHSQTHGFKNALRAALREDPDVILVGEMRDLETIKLALTAAETGHLVFGTLHTTSACKTVDRIVDVFSSEEKGMVRTMLSESLRAVVAQTLIKKKDGSGRVAAMEVLISTPAIRNLIRENKIPQMYSMIQTGKKLGMQTLEQELQRLAGSGIIDGSILTCVLEGKDDAERENESKHKEK